MRHLILILVELHHRCFVTFHCISRLRLLRYPCAVILNAAYLMYKNLSNESKTATLMGYTAQWKLSLPHTRRIEAGDAAACMYDKT